MNNRKKPHIIIFNPDQWRWDVMGHMGNPAAVTPIIDDLVATDAVSFSQAFCQNPVCTPSRCSFMTGWYPHVHGHRTMHHMLRPHEPVLLQRLRQEGYFVWWGGKNDLVPGQSGFDDYCDFKLQFTRPTLTGPHQLIMHNKRPEDKDYHSMYWGKLERPQNEPDLLYGGDWEVAEAAADFIRQAPDDKPLCMYMPLSYPHPPYAVEEPYFSMIDRSALPPRKPTPDGWRGKPCILPGIAQGQRCQDWTEQQWTELRAVYYAMCSRVDAQLGLIIEALRQSGMYDDTALFLFSDHGDFTGDYGLVEKTQNTFEDCLTRVPLVIKPPSNRGVQPRVSEALVELVDFPATVADLAGIDLGYDQFGKSLLPLVGGQTEEHRDAVFCEGGRRRGERQAMELASMTGPESLYYPRVRLQTQDDGPEHGKATMVRDGRYKYVRRMYEQDELYDLQSDPGELDNRIDDPALAAELWRLKERILLWYQETCDVVPRDADKR